MEKYHSAPAAFTAGAASCKEILPAREAADSTGWHGTAPGSRVLGGRLKTWWMLA